MRRGGGGYRPRPRPIRRGRSQFERAPRPPAPVNGYSLTLMSPTSGITVRDRRPDVRVYPVSVLGDPVDVQMEWRTTMPWISNQYPPYTYLPVPTYATEHLALPSGTEVTLEPPADLTYTTWYFRVRAGQKSTNTWGDWTSAGRFVNVNPILGSLAEYLDMNVGAPRPVAIGTVAYMEMNVGVALPIPQNATGFTDLNIGHIPGWRATSIYSDLNVRPPLVAQSGASYTDMFVDATLKPVPHLWWIRPEQGREGYVFHLYGHGFGSFQNAYLGRVVLGALVCAVVRWLTIPALPRTVTIDVAGTRRSTVSDTLLPNVLIDPGSVVIAAGDTIEYDVKWDAALGAQQNIFLNFLINGYGNVAMGFSNLLLNDAQGRAWIADLPEAYGSWHHRKFVVPVNHPLVARAISAFNVSWYGFDTSPVVRAASMRSIVVRDAAGAVKRWVTGDFATVAAPLTYTPNTGVLMSATSTRDSDIIIHGQGLDPDVITPEHGWVTVVVPSGAVSAMVKVVLEG